MPTIDFDVTMLSIKGATLKELAADPDYPDDRSKDNLEPITLRGVVVSAILREEQGLDYKEKLARYALAKKIEDGGQLVELEVKEAAKCQKQLAKHYGPLVVGQAWPLLEGRPEKEESAPEKPEPEKKAAPSA